MTTEIDELWTYEELRVMLNEAHEIGKGIQFFNKAGEWVAKAPSLSSVNGFHLDVKYRAKPKPKITYYHVYEDDSGSPHALKNRTNDYFLPGKFGYIGTIEVES